jgi:hypothetical protein
VQGKWDSPDSFALHLLGGEYESKPQNIYWGL